MSLPLDERALLRPPLWTWLAAFLIALALLSILAAVEARRGPEWRAQYFGADRLRPDASGRGLAVLIGSSKARCAVEPDALMTKRLERRSLPLRFVRVTRDKATARDFPELFAALKKVRPRLVLVEADLLIYEPFVYRGPRESPYRDRRQRIRDVLEAALIPGLMDSSARQNRSPRVDSSCDYGHGREAGGRRHLEGRRASTPEERAPYLDLARQLVGSGTVVAMARFPQRNDAIGAMPAKLVRAGEAVRQQLIAHDGFVDLGTPPALPVRAFHDAGHLTTAGRGVYSAWLAGRIDAAVSGSRR